MKHAIGYGFSVTATVFAIGLMSTGPAHAACDITEWKNTMAGHVVTHITGRACNGLLSVNARGVDPQGQAVDLGWVQAEQTGQETFTAAYVGADAANNLTMEVDPANHTMRVEIVTQYNDGKKVDWFGDFELVAVTKQN